MAKRGIRAVAAQPLETPKATLDNALAHVPARLRSELLARYEDCLRHFYEGSWEGAILNAAKFCEVVYSILRGAADGTYPERAQKPKDMVAACRSLELRDPGTLNRALRIQIPRAIPAVYEVRNNRGTGHVGGEVDPNRMDAVYVVHACRWMLADLVRNFHQLPIDEAEAMIAGLSDRVTPLVWDIAGTRRVLDAEADVSVRALILLDASSGFISEDNLRQWVRYENASRFRTRILRELDRRNLVHFDRVSSRVSISPLGRQQVESYLKERGLVS